MAPHQFDTFRIRGFPADFSPASFASFLSQENLQHVGTASIAADAACSGSARTATLTVKQEEDRKVQVPDTYNGVRLTVDQVMEAFTPLNDVGNTQSYVDIVAVTGLAGRAFGSWQNVTGEMWLRDYIPRDVQKCRIHIYGYQSALQKSTSSAGLLNYTQTFLKLLKTYLEDVPTRRPLILVGHSLGCLIIKHMLAEYRHHAEYKDFLNRVYSIVLFGAPHRGLNTTALETLVEHSRREPLIKDLKSSSTFLELLSERFALVSKDVKTITCFELKETPTAVPIPGEPGKWRRDGPLAMMVEPASACLYTSNEVRIGLNDKNHSEIGKLHDDWPAYQELRKLLTKHVQAAPRTIAARFNHQDAIGSLKQICTIGQSLVSMFVARALQLPASAATGSFEPSGLLSSTIGFLDQLRTFLEDEIAVTILQRESLPIPSAQRIFASISAIQGDFLQYARFSRTGTGDMWSRSTTSEVEQNNTLPNASIFDWTDPLLHDDKVSILIRKSSSCAAHIRTEIIFAMLGLEAETVSEHISQSTSARSIGVANALKRQKLLRAASRESSDSSSFTPLQGFIEYQEPARNLNFATYFSKPGENGSEVIVERRTYAQRGKTILLSSTTKRTIEEQEQRDKKQLGQLGAVLKQMTATPDDKPSDSANLEPEPSTLRCLGYVDEANTEPKQVVMIFEIPQLQIGSTTKDITDLHSAITAKTIGRRLDERFRLARSLCLAVLNLHSYGWLHKDIRSQNTLLIPTTTSTEPLSLYLRGFEYARHTTDSTTLTAVHDLETNLYRHPARQGKPTVSFKKEHDLYAVGVVLYEIGTLRTVMKSLEGWLQRFFQHGAHPEGEVVAKELRRRAATDLPMVMGPKYAEAVRRCLEGDFGVKGREDDDEDEVQTELSVRFSDLVLDAVEVGCQL